MNYTYEEFTYTIRLTIRGCEYLCLLSMQDGELSLHAGYIVPDSRVLSVDDFIELYL